MKKFTKICLIIAAVMGAFGLSLVIAGAVLGITSDDLEKAKLSWDLDRNRIVATREDVKDVKETFDHVEKLDVEVQAGDITIEEADVKKVTVTGTKVYESFRCWMDGNTLKVEDKNKKYVRIAAFSTRESDAQILVQIPRGANLKDMDLEISAGALQANGFRTEKLDLNCGAGSAYLEGDVSGESDLECGMGELIFTGSLGGKSSIDCGMGSAVLTLDNKQSDFNYDLECGMGEINVGDNSIGGIGGDQKIDMGADKEMNINCGMGSVDVIFEQ